MKIMHTLAIDIGGTKFTVGGFVNDQLRFRESFLTDRTLGPEPILTSIAQVLSNWQLNGSFHPTTCGIGFGGPVNFAGQSVIFSTHVPGWDGFPLIERIKSLTGASPLLDNDANVGALGESTFGAGRNCQSIFYLTLSTGIGGGVVIDRKLYRGADSFAGEIGHMNLVPDGPDCLCGSRGCFERMCCGLWLERDYGKPAIQLLSDPEFVEKYVVLLARGLKAALMILNPERLVIGGGISKAGLRLFGPLLNELNRQMTSWSGARRDVVAAELGDDSVLYGALALSRMGEI